MKQIQFDAHFFLKIKIIIYQMGHNRLLKNVYLCISTLIIVFHLCILFPLNSHHCIALYVLPPTVKRLEL